MDWIFDHLQLIFVVGGALAWWLNQRKQAHADDDVQPPQQEATFDDPELADRTRRIREEIQRKIEQRARGYADEKPTLPHDHTVDLPPVIREVVVARQPVRPTSRVEAQRQAEILEEQATLMERLHEAESMKLAAQKRIEFEAATADHSVEVRSATRTTILDDLSSPAALRRAFILREVLGPPVSLRG